MAALIIQAVAVALFMVGNSLALWIAGAILVGVSSAIVWASCLSLIVSRTEKSQLAQVLSFTSISLSCGDFLGPVTGGAIYGAGGSEAVFGLIFGLIGIDAILRLLMVESSVELAGNDSIVDSGVKATTHRAEIDATTDSDEESTAQSAEHTVDDGSHAEPTTTPSWSGAIQLLKSPRLLGALWVTVTQATILTSFDASLTIHLRNTFHWKSTQAGLVFISLIFPAFLSPLVGMIADRHGGRYITATGFCLSTAVLACLRFVDHDSIEQKVLLCALLFLVGLLLGTTLSVFSAEVSHVVFEHEEKNPGELGDRGAVAQAESLWWAAYSIGAAFGPLLGGLVQNAAGWKTMTWTLALLSATAVVPIMLFTDGPLFSRRASKHDPNDPSEP
jgi:MFS family permease